MSAPELPIGQVVDNKYTLRSLLGYCGPIATYEAVTTANLSRTASPSWFPIAFVNASNVERAPSRVMPPQPMMFAKEEPLDDHHHYFQPEQHRHHQKVARAERTIEPVGITQANGKLV